MTYGVEKVLNGATCDHGSPFEVAHFYHSPHYRPRTKGWMVYDEGTGFELTMWCEERNPKAVYTHSKDPVHTDSCMEGFIDFYPQLKASGYLSLEMNANSAAHCSFGTGRHTRRHIVDMALALPHVSVEKLTQGGVDIWRTTALIPLSLIKALYGRCDFNVGHNMRGNFYKCGDHTADPHWGSWNPIDVLDFHQPQCFGQLIIV